MRPLSLALGLSITLVGSIARAAARDWQWQGVLDGVEIAQAQPDGGGWLAIQTSGEADMIVAMRDGNWHVEFVPDAGVRLLRVWMSPWNEAFVLASNGVLFRRPAGGTWSSERPAGPSSPIGLNLIDGRSARDLWIAGRLPPRTGELDSSLVLHFDGTHWSRITTPHAIVTSLVATPMGAFLGANVPGPGHPNGVATVLRATPTGAVVLSPLAVQPYAHITALFVRAPNDIVAAIPQLVRFDGRRWTPLPGNLAQLHDVTLVGNQDVAFRNGTRWDTWRYEGVALVAAVRTGDVVHALDTAGRQVELRHDGFTISPVPPLRTQRLCNGGDAWLASDRAWVFHVTRDVLRAEPVSGHAVGCGDPDHTDDPDHVERESESGVLRRGADTFAIRTVALGQQFVREQAGRTTVLADPWIVAEWGSPPEYVGGGPGPTDDVWLSGRGSLVRYHDGHFRRFALPAASRESLLHVTVVRGQTWGTGSDGEVFEYADEHWIQQARADESMQTTLLDAGGMVTAFADGRVLVHRPGGYFARLASDGGLAAGMRGLEVGPIAAAGGTSPSDVWAVVRNRVVHFDGHQWSLVRTYSDEPLSALAVAGNAIDVVGGSGRLIAGVGGALRPRGVGSRNDLRSVFARGADDVFVGADGWISHGSGSQWTVEWHPPTREADGTTVRQPRITAFAEWNHRLYALAEAHGVWVRDGSAWNPVGPSDPMAWVVQHQTTRTTYDDDSSYRAPDDDDASRATNATSATREPSIRPCAVIAPRAQRLVVVSCGTQTIADFDGTSWSSYRVPLPIRGATCIPGDACYLILERGVVRADPARL